MTTQREALEHRLVTLMAKAERTFRLDGTVHLPKVITTTVEDAWMAWREHAYARVEQLIAVAEFLIARERTKFKSAPQKYIERSKELAA